MSFLNTSSTESSLEWDYNDNNTQQIDYNEGGSSAAKRLFSWDFDITKNSSGKCPRMDLEDTLEKVLSPEDEIENFENIMKVNLQRFQNISALLQNSVKLPSPSKRVEKALHALKKSIAKVTSLENKVNAVNKKLVNTKKEVKNLQSDTEDLERKCNDLEICEEKQGEKLQSLRNVLENKEIFFEKAKQGVSKEVSAYEKYLGLQLINSTHGGIIFVFRNISRDQPSKRFCFELLLSGRHYEMNNCHPMVENNGEMVKTLNKTGDLSGFVSQIRGKFLDII